MISKPTGNFLGSCTQVIGLQSVYDLIAVWNVSLSFTYLAENSAAESINLEFVFAYDPDGGNEAASLSVSVTSRRLLVSMRFHCKLRGQR